MADETPRLWTCEACGANLDGAPGLKCPFCGHLHEHGQVHIDQPMTALNVASEPDAAGEVGTAHAGLVDATILPPAAVEVASHGERAPEAEPQPEPVAPVVDHVEAPAPLPSAPPAVAEPAPPAPQEPPA